MDLRIILTLALIIPTLIHPVFAQSCTDIALEIREIHSPAFAKYPLLSDMQQDILLILYGRERGSCPQYVMDFSTATRDFILKFDEAFRLANSDISEDHLAAVKIARQLKEEASILDQMKGDFGVEAEDLANSAHQVVRDFLLVQAGTYAREAEATDVTRRKIMFYREASIAYEAADEALEASNNKIKETTLEERYNSDMEKADELFSKAEEEYEKAARLMPGNAFSKIDAYILSRDAKIHLQEARVYYQYHHETEKITKVESSLLEIEDTLQTLKSDLAIFFSGVAGILILVSTFLVHRLNAWNRDTHDYFLGNELVQVSSSEI